MRRFMVVSGFLGSGKTTTMMALTEYLNYTGRKTVMISNDLGRKGLADHHYSKAAGLPSEEISGECICFVTEDLVDRLRRLYNDGGCQMVMSDIPGFGVGALEHVYCKLRDLYPGEFELAPFTVITEGASLSILLDDTLAGSSLIQDSALPEEMKYLLRSQLLEGDLIVLNKTDLYTEGEKAIYLDLLKSICPETPVMEISAETGKGIPELAEYMLTHGTEFPEQDFGVTEEEFESAFGKLSMYNCQYYAEVCCNDFDANEYLADLAAEIKEKLRIKGFDAPHLKLFARSEDGDYSKVDLLGVDRDVIITHAMSKRCTDIPVVLSTTSAADSEYLTKVIDRAILDVSGRHNLQIVIYYKECFGLNDDRQ